MKATSMKCQILVALGMMLFTSEQGTCESARHKAIRECEVFRSALKASRLATLSDEQLCNVRNSPITDLLSSPHIKDIDWQPYPVQSKAEMQKLAQRIHESTKTGLPSATLPRYAKSIAEAVAEFDAINAKTNTVAQQAALHVGQGTFYALNIKRSACDSTYRWTDPLPIWGIFRDPSHTEGNVTVESDAPGGHLFYMDGNLRNFILSPPTWNTHSPNLPKIKDRLFVAMEALTIWKDPHGNLLLAGPAFCTADIHRREAKESKL